MSTVLICTDNSETSNFAFEYYLKNVHREGNRVVVVHVPECWTNIGPMEGPTPGRLQELRQETNAKTKQIKDHAEKLLAAAGVQGEFFPLEGKDPWETICKYASTNNASMIVIGSRGQGTIKRTFMGSVSDSVLHHAHCPVLVCRK